MKVALVTGANKGIGLETAQHQVHVLLGARDEASGQAAAATLRAEGLAATFIQIDISRREIRHYGVCLRHNTASRSSCMSLLPFSLANPVLHAILERVLRSECLALEGLRLQAQVHNGLLGGDVEELVQTAEKRAYQRANPLLEQLLAANTSSIPTNDLR